MTLNQIPFTAAANLTRDPELRYTPSGKSVAAVRLAITPPGSTRPSRAATSTEPSPSKIGPSLAFATAAVTRNPRINRAEQEGSQDGADVEPAGEPAIT
jgi:hypothetical protein